MTFIRSRLFALNVALMISSVPALPVTLCKAETSPKVEAGKAVVPAEPAAKPTAAEPAAPSAPPPAPISAVLPPEVNDTIAKVVGTMEGAEKTLTAITTVDTDLGRLRDDIDGVIAKTTQTADSLRPRLADINSQVEKFGAAPDKAVPPEAPSIASEAP